MPRTPRSLPAAPTPEPPPAADETAARLKQADAAYEQAKAWNRLADTGESLLDEVKAIREATHDLIGRAGRLCEWLRSRWPWIGAAGLMLLGRTINVAPDEIPKLLNGLAAILSAGTGHA